MAQVKWLEGSPPKKTQDDSASDAAGIAAVQKPAPLLPGFLPHSIGNPFIASSSASDGAGKNVFARGFSGFAPVVGGGEAEEGVFSKRVGPSGAAARVLVLVPAVMAMVSSRGSSGGSRSSLRAVRGPRRHRHRSGGYGRLRVLLAFQEEQR